MFNNLLKKGKIGSLELKNRLVMPPMGSGHGEPTGKVGDKLVEYYAARARGGFGLIITEFACISREGKAVPGQLMIDSDEYIGGFKALTDRVHDEGGKIIIQIHHAGRETNSTVTGIRPVAPSAVPCPVNKEIPRELSPEEIYQLVEKFGDAAIRAKKAGFDGVEVHGAHGYLVAQFASAYSNKRIDEFGGDLTGRMKFPIEVVKDIKKKCGKDFPISFRISGEERVEGGRLIDETVIIAKALEGAGADAIHVSTGVYASMPYIIPPASFPAGYNLDAARAVKQAVAIPVIAVGRINDPVVAENAIANGAADFVSLGRASIADPEFPKKVAENRSDEISPCVGCLTRCQGFPGVDPHDGGVSCMINPFSGHEATMKIENTGQPKNITVVGGGPGGLEAAWVAAARGHRVTLLEKSGKPGGQMLPACVSPGKHELARAVRYYVKMCQKYGVDIKLGTEADVNTVLSQNPDEVILATGGTAIKPPIPNDGIPVVQAVDLLAGRTTAGNRVLIVGGGMVGLETAEYLLTQNSKSTIAEMTDTVGAGLHPSVLYFMFDSLEKGGVEILKNTKVEKFTKDGAVCRAQTGEITLTGYDTAVLAMGAESCNPLEQPLKERGLTVHVIGDAAKPRKIIEAVEEAARLALKL